MKRCADLKASREKNFGALTSNNPIVHGMVSIGVEVITYVSYYLRTIVTGIVTALAPARWCRRRRDLTINNRWKVEGGSGEQSLHRVGEMILIVIIKLRKTHQSRIPTPFVFLFWV